MALDTLCVLHEFSAFLARICAYMVADRVQPWRSYSSELQQHNIHPLRHGYSQLCQLLPFIRRDAAYDRVNDHNYYYYRQILLLFM